jgi:hypothetical protein
VDYHILTAGHIAAPDPNVYKETSIFAPAAMPFAEAKKSLQVEVTRKQSLGQDYSKADEDLKTLNDLDRYLGTTIASSIKTQTVAPYKRANSFDLK